MYQIDMLSSYHTNFPLDFHPRHVLHTPVLGNVDGQINILPTWIAHSHLFGLGSEAVLEPHKEFTLLLVESLEQACFDRLLFCHHLLFVLDSELDFYLPVIVCMCADKAKADSKRNNESTCYILHVI